ncbi:hypothetical protein FS935_09515 [Metabacillus litoralis]|uniref:DUF3221 domain-containing protein n=1 Tax=Metabacillus litoralis TaxID=152268 RepID=A0A5C6VZW1_9BACI|nr:hypothetical protein [Metabacillus litoralis]TXC91128.1 hypothetical protein FS935_09515 [Metabacillus litoralis]
MKRTIFVLSITLLAGCGQITDSTIISSAKSTEQQNNSVEATYIGLIDNHSIEVIIENKPLALQISEKQKKQLELFETNKPLMIEYIHNKDTSQNILISFKEKGV